MLVILLIAIATVSCIGGLLIVSKAGEKDNICNYDYTEN